MQKYKIVRFFKEDGKNSVIIKTGLTLEEAQEHCQRPDTRKEGVWFDGFAEQVETTPRCHGCGVAVFPEDDNCCDRCLELSFEEE
tara:strand:- start:254 stop:508 length:255 start_codon:yes stop_codon:yes gene_type:complete